MRLKFVIDLNLHAYASASDRAMALRRLSAGMMIMIGGGIWHMY